MAEWRQFRLLLWKDYLIRKRKLVTVTGVVWTLLVMSSLYMVRVNISDTDYPTCQFPARALPSAGLLGFVQSFVCTVNNECRPMEQFQEVPAYERSKLSQLSARAGPLLQNATLLELAALLPDAVRLLATLADVLHGALPADGIHVGDLFANPARARRHLADELRLSDDASAALMAADVQVQAVLKGHIDRCSPESISLVLNITNKEYLNELSNGLCSMKDEELQKLFMDLIFEIDFSKYIKMIGDMYTKLTGDDRLAKLSDTITSVSRMSQVQSFLLPELAVLFQGREPDFTYFNTTIIYKFMDLFKPTFQDTDAYKNVRDFVDAAVTGIQIMSSLLRAQPNIDTGDAVSGFIVDTVNNKLGAANLTVISKAINNALQMFGSALNNGSTFDVFDMLAKSSNFIIKWLDADSKFDVLFYSTLLSKLIEGAQQVISINMNIEEVTYNTSLRHPEAVKILVNLPSPVINQAFESLVDSERTQLLISKYATPGQIFCDTNKLQYFLKIGNKDEAINLKNQLCTDVWKGYITDLVRSFGIVYVKDNINSMASLLIQNTIGKDTSSYLYTIERDFEVLRNFTNTLYGVDRESKKEFDWLHALNVTAESELMKISRSKAHLGKQMLITVHGALAKEVVSQNLVLSYKLSPFFKDMSGMVAAINRQLGSVPAATARAVRDAYPDIVETLLATALDEQKTYKALSTPNQRVLCGDVAAASLYLHLPGAAPATLRAMCAAVVAVDAGLASGSEFVNAITQIKNASHSALDEVPWTQLIGGLKQLYINLDTNYTYLFDWGTYGMSQQKRAQLEKMAAEAKEMWFGQGSEQRSALLCLNLVLRLLDLADSPAFGVTSPGWLQLKYAASAVSAPLEIAGELMRLVSEVSTNSNSTSVRLPQMTTLLLRDALRNLPNLVVDAADIVVRDQTDLEPILRVMTATPPWPCSEASLAGSLPLTARARAALVAVERLACFRELRAEWRDHRAQRRYSAISFNWKKNNYTTIEYDPHIFLSLSSNVNNLIDNFSSMRDSLSDALKEGSDGDELNMVTAVKRATQLLNRTDHDEIVRKFLHKFDIVLNALQLPDSPTPLYRVWESHSNCTTTDDDCWELTRALGAGALRFLSTAVADILTDLLTYFVETNEPNANVMQYLGFTKSTGLYILYDKMPEFLGVLLNSYFDYGFMTQVRRASQSRFWDCEGVVASLAPAAFAPVTPEMLAAVHPYICPSLLYWISLPRGDNVILDLVAKPQYYFYTLPIQNISSSFEKAYTNGIKFTKLILDKAKTNKTATTTSIDTIKSNFFTHVDKILSYKINDTDPSYTNFTNVNKKQFAAMLYLTKIVAIVNKIADKIENLKVASTDLTDEEVKKIETDLIAIRKIFQRRPHDTIAFHFDLLTDVLWSDDGKYDIVAGLDAMCQRLKNEDNSRMIVDDGKRTKAQICSKSYAAIYTTVQGVLSEAGDGAKSTLLRLVTVLNGDSAENKDVFKVINQSANLVETFKTSIKYAYDLGLPVYLKYLQSNVNHYRVVLSFTTGADWWVELRMLYNGPIASNFLDFVEKSFDVAEGFIKDPDQVYLVRLLSDINLNETELFCANDASIAEYLPDGPGLLADVGRRLCEQDHTDVVRDVPPMVIAAQGYIEDLKLSKDIDYVTLYSDINATEQQLDVLLRGAKAPRAPSWVTQARVDHLRSVAAALAGEEGVTKLSFGLLGNLVDAGTLFLNNSRCVLCSDLTKWFKQLNLQLFKKQEYDSLLCHIDDMSVDEVYAALKNDFHWDMAIGELLSSRNYTSLELNKAMSEFLQHVKLHLLEQAPRGHNKLADCLLRNVSRNAMGNVTLFLTVLSKTTLMLRAQAPHLHTVPGVALHPHLQRLSTQVAHNLDVDKPVRNVLNAGAGGELAREVVEGDVNLRLLIANKHEATNFLSLHNVDINDYCAAHDCEAINQILYHNINWTLVELELSSLQTTKFWRFEFVSSILQHVETSLSHAARLLGVASHVDLTTDSTDAILDFVMQLFTDDTFDDVLYSLQGITKELQPLLKHTPLDFDLQSLPTGLSTIRAFKNYLIKEVDLKFPIAQLFPDGDAVEASLSARGINHTNFWSLAAPRLREGYIDFKPLLPNKQSPYHVSSFACDPDALLRVVGVGGGEDGAGGVTVDDVMAAVTEQLCAGRGALADVAPAVMPHFNYSVVVEKLSSILLPQLYSAARLPPTRGAAVLARAGDVAALLPALRGRAGELAGDLAAEPLLQRLRNVSSVGNLLGSSDFLPELGRLMCGSPFTPAVNRIYKAVVSGDLADTPDQRQLDSLPTEFCRSLYKDITSVAGGKVVWSFLKPLVMGKILYAPVTPAVTRVVSQANTTFAHMIRMTSLLREFAASFPLVEGLAQRRDSLKAMAAVMTSLDLGGAPAIDVDDVFEDFEGMKDMGALLQKASNVVECFDWNRFHGVRDEDALVRQAAELTADNEFSNGLVFLKADLGEDGRAPDVEYKIRMDIENVPTTSRLKNYLWIPGPEANFLEDMRYFRGFVQIQDMIDKAVIELTSSRIREKRESKPVEDMEKYAIYTQQMPYPCYKKDYFQTSLYESQALIVAFFFALLFTVCSAVRLIVYEKETLNTMLMSIMGVSSRAMGAAWAAGVLLELAAAAAAATLLLKAASVLPRTDASLLFTLIMLFAISVVSFCYLLSRLLRSAGAGAVAAGLAYLLTFLPFVVVLALEARLGLLYRCLLCLSMSSSFCYALLLVARAEAAGEGLSWAAAWGAGGGDVTAAQAGGFLLLDAVLYLALAVLWDHFYGIKALKSSITVQSTTADKAGVSILHVSKVYNKNSRNPTAALDDVCVELRRGEVTTLLGHNGAGKTTLIKILTGMERPCSGAVVVRSAGRKERAGRAGLCPQHDVLLDCLTAAEHVALYAALAAPAANAAAPGERSAILQQLRLGAQAHEPAWRLSGGTRRRLCVALAFVGQPALVALDEPTANVDPKARRDIWALINQLKQDKTILLTTHHMDEAEILSDQIVILHKGQVHTTGSPIEIKRSLGDGYKLFVTYPELTHLSDDEQLSDVEERSKALLALVRRVVGNAAPLEVARANVELLLPFYDEHGCNNNFLQLFESLERSQRSLGWRALAVDCCTLEQVFYNVCRGVLPGDGGTEPDVASKSGSTSSGKSDVGPLLDDGGPLAATPWVQFKALLEVQFLHYSRDYWQLFLLVCVPALFVLVAMCFSLVRPPADNERALLLDKHLYHATEFIVPLPSAYGDYSDRDIHFAKGVLQTVFDGENITDWNEQDTPECSCVETRQVCPRALATSRDTAVLRLPDVHTLNHWLVNTQADYIEKRYGGFTAAVKDNVTNLVVWYNNKGHHALPAFLSTLNAAILRHKSGGRLRTYSHPMKITHEQLTKDNVYQHVADAGIACLLVLAWCAAAGGAGRAGGAARRLQWALRGAPPAAVHAAALAPHLVITVVNVAITAAILYVFGFPVFVYRTNLPAICLLLFMFGMCMGCLSPLLERCFADGGGGLAAMTLFCGNAFAALSGVTLLLILDIISESEATDSARWWLHKALLVFPQFALADGLLEVAKNTIKAQVLLRFGMNTYRPPLTSSLLSLHFASLLVSTVVFIVVLLLIDHGVFQRMWLRFLREPALEPLGSEHAEVTEERRRVTSQLHNPIRLNTLGNINAGFIDSEAPLKPKPSPARPPGADILSCVDLTKIHAARRGKRTAVDRLTIGFQPGQCTVLLGQNGAGKSTTFAMLTGQALPSAGAIYVDGEKVDSRDLHTGIISYCPQANVLDPFLTVEETLRFYCKLSGSKNEEESCQRWLRMLRLSRVAARRCGALSGGTARRAAAAAALTAPARLAALDEPGSGMDPSSRMLLGAALRAWCGASRAALLSTHAVSDLRAASHHVALLHAARLQRLFPSRGPGLNAGYIVDVRVCGGGRAAWRRMRGVASRVASHVASRVALRAAHGDHLRLQVTPGEPGKEDEIKISDIFRLMVALQANCDIEDYTINQTSLDEMFLSSSYRDDELLSNLDEEDVEKHSLIDENLHIVTSL